MSEPLSLQPKQSLAYLSPATEILYGGAAGGGKSHLMRVAAINWSWEIPGLQTFLFRRISEDLQANHMEGPSGFPVMLAPWVAAGVVKFNLSKGKIEFKNGPKGGYVGGSVIKLCHCQHEKDKYKYQGAEIHLLLIDELTHFTESIYRWLRGRVRLVTVDMPDEYRKIFPRIIAGANPGGIGHGWVKHTWIDPLAPMDCQWQPPEQGGLLRQYIPARLEDNPILMEQDPGYEARLSGLGSPELVKAMREGNWDVFVGQAFPDFNKDTHVIEPLHEIPENWPIYTTFDWGFGKPFSWAWWTVNNDGVLIRFHEWYGWNGQPDQGLRLTDPEIAAGIKEREADLKISHRKIIRLAGHDCFNRRADFQGGGQGPPTSETFARQGVYLVKADPTRTHGIRQFRERLRMTNDGPMLLVTRNCEQFIRTIPTLIMDEKTMEDIESASEDHVYDECRQICMARAMKPKQEHEGKTKHEKRLEMLEKGMGGDPQMMALEREARAHGYNHW